MRQGKILSLVLSLILALALIPTGRPELYRGMKAEAASRP
ncbi:MAG: hypothetical protein RIR52_422, partial [Acidobacteriota bacterium]